MVAPNAAPVSTILVTVFTGDTRLVLGGFRLALRIEGSLDEMRAYRGEVDRCPFRPAETGMDFRREQ